MLLQIEKLPTNPGTTKTLPFNCLQVGSIILCQSLWSCGSKEKLEVNVTLKGIKNWVHLQIEKVVLSYDVVEQSSFVKFLR